MSENLAKTQPEKLTKAQFVSMILDEDMNIIQDDEDIIHMLLDKTISKNINDSHKETLSFGARVSDGVARVAGSWTFIISFCTVLAIWITVNVILLTKAFDPFPFILLNLVLSCIAALQAPVIMMSQNRQEQKDRLRAANDYKVNLKSELIVEDLHAKLDKLIINHELIIARLDSMDTQKV
jgi:uncharacterized membrane protein